jgi:hypothetical protein
MGLYFHLASAMKKRVEHAIEGAHSQTVKACTLSEGNIGIHPRTPFAKGSFVHWQFRIENATALQLTFNNR